MTSEPKIGLVTVLYNGIEVLQGFFESLAKQTYKNYVLYVIDNSPNEDALNEAKRLSNEFNIPSEFIYNNANLGVAKGNNQGIELSMENNCDYVLLLNNDIEFSEDTICKMLEYAENNNEKIIVPKIYYYGTNKLWMAGGDIIESKGSNIHRGEGEEDIGQYSNIEYIGYAPTCFMLINTEVFEKIGLMDEDYFVYWDDTDFVYRSMKKYKILYYPDTTVYHKVSFSTGGDESSFSVYYMVRNRILFIFKNYSSFNRVKLISTIVFKNIVKLFLIKTRQKKALLKGTIEGLKWTLK